MSIPRYPMEDYLAGLPAMVGYELHDEATISLLDANSAVIVVAVVHNGTSEDYTAESIGHCLQTCAEAGITPASAIITTHSQTGSSMGHLIRSARLERLLLTAGLDGPVVAFAVAGGLVAWPVGDPDAAITLPGRSQYGTVRELVNGRPAASREQALAAYHPLSGPLRDAVADALPAAAAAATAQATASGGALWRRATITAVLERLSDPQPLTGPQAAAALLALSDTRVRDHVIATTVTDIRGGAAATWAGSGADTDHLATLARHAPPGLAEGPATVLAAALLAGSAPAVQVHAAAHAATLDGGSHARLAARVDEAANERTSTLLDELARPRPISGLDKAPPAFATGSGQWPDPLAGYPVPGFDPLGVDPLAADPLGVDPFGGVPIDGPDDTPEVDPGAAR